MNQMLINLFNWPDESIARLSRLTGADEGGIRLITSLLISYPIQLIYSAALAKQNLHVKSGYFFVTGLILLMFNYGWNVLHLLLTALTVYTTLISFPMRRSTVAFNFIFSFGYLMIGYWSHLSNEYSFEWTIAHCVITLRLIGISFDMYDRNRIEPKKEGPKLNFSEFLGFSFFPSTVLIGPQFDFTRYQKFVQQCELPSNHFWNCLGRAVRCLCFGLIYLAVYQIASQYVPVSLLESFEYQSQSFWIRVGLVTLVTRAHLYKYLSSWLLAEGATIASGLTYDPGNKSFWPISNVHFMQFEVASTFTDIIRSFNVTTNQWCATYIYKRLKFLKMRTVSHFATLTFLAFWHGWKSGYYVTFLLEFVIVIVEKDVTDIITCLRLKYAAIDVLLKNRFYQIGSKIVLHVFTFSLFGYCLVPFIMLTHKKYLPVLSDLYYIGHFMPFLWLLFSPLIWTSLKSSPKTKDN